MKRSKIMALGLVVFFFNAILAQDRYVFDYTGKVDTFIIPQNVCRIVVKVWGAGGGGGGADACGSGGPGGGGAYVEATYSSIVPGTIWEIYVGGGGGGGASGNAAAGGSGGWGYGIGGNGGSAGGVGGSGGGGGGAGASAIIQNGVPLLVAGGGGGGGGAGLDTPCAGAGGAAGNPGEDGGAGCTSLPGQAGASITPNGTDGGSVGSSDDGGGGGGGGGGYDGSGGGGGTGGGAAPADCGGAGGGGGASFGSTIIVGVGQTPGNAGDPDLCAGCAVGGNPGQAGGNGRVVIYVYKNPVITLDSTVASLCDTPTGKVFITVDSAIQPYDFSWFSISGSLVDTTEDLNGVFPGDYVVFVEDSLGCLSVDTFTVLGTDSGTYDPGVPDSFIVCHAVRDTILITPSGGSPPYSISFTPSVPPYLNCINSNCDSISVYSSIRDTVVYQFTITDNFGCKVYDSMKLIIYRPRVTLSTDTPWACWRYGDTITALVSGAVIGDTIYNWNFPQGSTWNTITQDGDSVVIMGLPPVDSFLFSVTVSDDYCDTTIWGYFKTRYLFTDARILDRTVCRGQEAVAWAWPLLGDVPFSYTWNIQNVPWNCNPNCDTVYMTITDTAYVQLIVASVPFGCADTVDTTILPLNDPVFFVRPNTLYPCHGQDSVYVEVQVFSSNGPYSVGWSPLVPECFNDACDKFVFGPPFPDPVTIYVEVVDSEGCRTLDSFTIIPDYIHVDAQDLYGCKDKFDIARATVTGNVGSYFLTWYPPQFFECNTCNETKVELLDSVKAVVVAVDSIGCMAFDTFNIIVWNNPDFYLPEDTTVIRNAIIEFSLPQQYDYSWQPTTYVECPTCPTTEVAVYEDYQRYYVTAHNEYGCYTAKMIEIRSIEVHCDSAEFFVPSIFSPNGDGINDILYVYGNADALIETFMVWDRWGKLLFRMESVPISINTLHSEQGWDGSSVGDLQRPDVYSYYAKIRCPSGTMFELRGDVTLMR